MKNLRNKNNKNRLRSERERGVALIAALFALMLISALAMAMVFSTTTESAVNNNFKDSEVAEYAAHAGIQEARERLIDTAGDYLGANIPTQLPTVGAGGVLYITNPAQGEVVQPQNTATPYFDAELCHDNFPAIGMLNTGNNVPCGAAPAGVVQPLVASTAPDTGTQSALNYKWVRITQKANLSAGANWLGVNPLGPNTVQVCWDRSKNRQTLLPAGYFSCDQDPIGGTDGLRTVYMLTSLAVTPRGTRRMAQAEVAFDPPISLLAAVESDDNVSLNGALTVSGYDNCSCDCSGKGLTYQCNPRPGHVGGCNGSKLGIYASGSVENPTGAAEQVYSGQGTGSGLAYQGNNTLPKSGTFPYKVQDLVNQYSQLPGVVDVTKSSNYNWTCTGTPPNADCGTHSTPSLGGATFPLAPTADNPAGMSPQITYVPGNVSITSSATGSGILIVNGNLDLHGGMQFYGLILVSGSVTFNGGGSSGVNLYGGLLSGDPVQDNTDTTTLGGSVSIQYDYCALKNSNKGQMPRTLALRELSY